MESAEKEDPVELDSSKKPRLGDRVGVAVLACNIEKRGPRARYRLGLQTKIMRECSVHVGCGYTVVDGWDVVRARRWGWPFGPAKRQFEP